MESRLVDEGSGGRLELGIPAIALFPVIEKSLKDEEGSLSIDRSGMLQKGIEALKRESLISASCRMWHSTLILRMATMEL